MKKNFIIIIFLFILKNTQCQDSIESRKKLKELNNCKTVPLYCESNPCLNGGTCIEIKDKSKMRKNDPPFACICAENYRGLNCNKKIISSNNIPDKQDDDNKNKKYDLCSKSNPCLNGGTCFQLDSNFKCKCMPNYNGTNCENRIIKSIDLCKPNTCLNQGICVTQQLRHNQFQIYCFCTPEYTGVQCQTSVNSTIYYKTSCNKNGLFLNGTCKCFTNYYGSNCQFKFKSVVVVDKIMSCPADLCLHGTCKVPSKLKNTFYCVCEQGYVGTRCDQRNHCVSSICENGGTCVNDENDYYCKCKSNYYGKNCDKTEFILKNKTMITIVENKVISKCYNGGSTTNENDFSPCYCQPGFIGFKCEINVCMQQVTEGTCNDNLKRFHFDQFTNECKSFTYSGCEGNQNNFESKESCNYHCVKN